MEPKHAPVTAIDALINSSSMAAQWDSCIHCCAADAWYHERTTSSERMACSSALDTVCTQQRQHVFINVIMSSSSLHARCLSLGAGGEAAAMNMIIKGISPLASCILRLSLRPPIPSGVVLSSVTTRMTVCRVRAMSTRPVF